MVCQLVIRIFFFFFPPLLLCCPLPLKMTVPMQLILHVRRWKKARGHISLSFVDLVGRICLFCSHFDLCFWLFGDQLILSDSSWPVPQNFREIRQAPISGRRDFLDSLGMITFVGLQHKAGGGGKDGGGVIGWGEACGCSLISSLKTKGGWGDWIFWSEIKHWTQGMSP